MQSTDDTGIRINNVALAETVYLFVDLSIQLFRLASPVPSRITITLGLTSMRTGRKFMSLSPLRANPFNLADDRRESTTDRAEFETSFQLDQAEPGTAAYGLLSLIYTWFGFEESEIPYTTPGANPPRIDYDAIIQRAR